MIWMVLFHHYAYHIFLPEILTTSFFCLILITVNNNFQHIQLSSGMGQNVIPNVFKNSLIFFQNFWESNIFQYVSSSCIQLHHKLICSFICNGSNLLLTRSLWSGVGVPIKIKYMDPIYYSQDHFEAEWEYLLRSNIWIQSITHKITLRRSGSTY